MAVERQLSSPVGDERSEAPTFKIKHLVLFERTPDNALYQNQLISQRNFQLYRDRLNFIDNSVVIHDLFFLRSKPFKKRPYHPIIYTK